jgi:hypothetical protein
MKPIFLALAVLTAPIAAGSMMLVLPASAKAASDLGDLSSFRKILVDVQAIADKGDFKAAEKRITDFETAWDVAHKKMRPLNKTQWGNVDVAADAALEALRAESPVAGTVKKTLATLVGEIDDPNLVP